MRPQLKLAFQRTIPWLLFGAVLLPALATTAVGIVVLSLWRMAGDIALGTLTIVFAVFTLAGAIVTLSLLIRQQRLAAMQTEFIANVSHELRTPLSSIRMFTETLQLGRFRTDEERERCLATLEREVTRLTGLVEQLLDFRSIIQRSAETEREVMEAEVLVREVVAPFAERDRSAWIFLQAEPDLPRLNVSRWGFNAAMSNLVQNALSHGGPEKPVEIIIRTEDEGVAFDVKDQGPGLTPKEQKRIFRRFYQGSTRDNQDRPGFGLGLAIVQDFADAHGGRASVQSTPGEGSVFTLWLPRADTPEEETPTTEPEDVADKAMGKAVTS